MGEEDQRSTALARPYDGYLSRLGHRVPIFASYTDGVLG